MNRDDDRKRINHARQCAADDLDKVRNILGHRRVAHLGLFFDDMRTALYHAMECWLMLQGDDAHGGWPDAEARFLQLAPRTLRHEYRVTVREVTRLAGIMLERIGPGEVREAALAAPSLDAWCESAMSWLRSAEQLVAALTADAALVRLHGDRRTEHGMLHGDPCRLMPCFLLDCPNAGTSRLVRSQPLPGMFGCERPDSRQRGVAMRNGLILPVELCRDARLRLKLQAFAELLRLPRADRLPGPDDAHLTLPPSADGRRRALQAWLDQEGLGCLRLADRKPVYRWARLKLSREVFPAILEHFDYATALLDGPKLRTRIADHAAFRWSSPGELLDWAVGGDDADGLSSFKFRFCG